MAQVLLFHSALGIRAGITELAEALRTAGHTVTVVDQYDGQVFESYDEAMAHVEATGFPSLITRALDGAKGVAGPFVAVGFSNGAGMAQAVAASRPDDVRGVVMIGGGLPMRYLEMDWPTAVPGQIHVTDGDPWHEAEADEILLAEAERAGARIEVFTYPGTGHLFSDPTLPEEYQPAEAALLTERVIAFVGAAGSGVS